MMVLGVTTAWGQAGIWYIANTSRGNAKAAEYTYDANSPSTNYYLVPAADPKQANKLDAYYSEDGYATPGDPARPFITTYKTNRDNNSIWFVSPSGEDGFYFIIHAATGKYLIYEPPHSAATNRKSMHLQIVDDGTYNPSTNANFKFAFNKTGNNYFIRPHEVSSGNYLFNVANKNFNNYYGPSGATYYHEGLVGLYSSGHEWFLDDASGADFVKPVISDLNEATNTFTISFPTVSITYPYTTDSEDIKALGITSIIYTTNGDEPTVDGATTRTYSSAIYLDEPCTVKARGVYGNNSMTPVVSKTFDNIYAVCALPTFAYNHSDKTVTITSLGPTDATFYYTLNGDNPTTTVSETNFQYADTPIAIPDNCNVVKAIAVSDGFENSSVSSISRVETPTFGYNTQGVTISCAIEGASIYYTTDSSDPTTDSTPYNGAINLSNSSTIKAIAVKDGYIHSSIVSFTPLSPIGISYDVANNKVVITNATEGATIYYTTGTTESNTPDPTGSEKIEYTYGNTGFEPEDNVGFIKAIAVKGLGLSPEAQLAIVIQTSTAGVDRPYLIQSAECMDFYMIPGDITSGITYVNTSSLGRPSMEWFFYSAGNEGGVEYYYIKNKATDQYVCYSGSKVRLNSESTFNNANADDKKNYKFSISYANTTTKPGYYIHPFTSTTAVNGLSKRKGNSTEDNLELANATNNANSFARWYFVASVNRPAIEPPFTLWGENDQYQYYKVKSLRDNTFMVPNSEMVTYPITKSGSESNMFWYFYEADHDDWNTYYYIVNAASGEYLCFDGASNKTDNDNAFVMKEQLETNNQRYQFAFAKTITAAQYYIIPRVLKDLKNGSCSLVFWDGSASLMSKADRAANGGLWTFVESDATAFCPPRISLDADGKVTMTSRTIGAEVQYTVGSGSEQTFNGSTDPIATMSSEGGQVVITTKTSLGGITTQKPMTVVYKPTIELAPDQSIVYNGQKHIPEVSSVTIEATELKDHCVVSSNDINAGNATAVITQIKDDADYVIYGTAPFTIAKSPLTIYADSKTIEYGDDIPEFSFSTEGLAAIDEVYVNLSCDATTNSNLGTYPITFSNLENKSVKYEIKRNNSDASSNYKDITLIPSSLIRAAKILGDGTQIAEGITAKLTTSGDDITLTAGNSSLGDDDYDVVVSTEGYYQDRIWTITGKGHYTGRAELARVKSNFTEKENEWRAGYVASHDWAIPEGSNIKAWIATDLNSALNVLRVKEVNYLPAGVPAILTATGDKSNGVLVSPKSDDVAELTDAQKDGNLFKVVTDMNGLDVEATDTYKYVFYKGELVLAFKGTLPQGTIYVDSYKNGSPVAVGAPLRMEKEGDLTGIIEINEDKNIRPIDDKWYSLDGWKLSGKPGLKGLYIHRGRKVVVK